MSDADHRGRIRNSLLAAKRGLRNGKYAVKRRLGLFEPLELVAYRSEGWPDRLRVRGRVIERSGVRSGSGDDPLFRNMLSTIRRLESDEIPNARIAARYGGEEILERTDEEGFFQLEIEPAEPIRPGWHRVDVEILGSMAGGAGVTAAADVLVPSADAEFLVVSDMDDTIIHTHATDALTQARLLLSRNADTIATMPGAAPLYRALESGPDRNGRNPFFYVSMSGWGLYDLFREFLDGRGFPRGPVFLQDLALLEEKSRAVGQGDHKRDRILKQIDEYPDLPFVLIGDSGQADPETYRDIVRERPDRVRAVLLRDVTPPERDRDVRRIVQEIEDLGVSSAAAESSVSLARAAVDFGLIPSEVIGQVRRAMIGEESPR